MIERVRLRPHQAIAIDEALTNPKLLGNALGHVSSWSTWLTLCGPPMDCRSPNNSKKSLPPSPVDASHQLIACANYGPSLADVVANHGWRPALPVTQHY